MTFIHHLQKLSIHFIYISLSFFPIYISIISIFCRFFSSVTEGVGVASRYRPIALNLLITNAMENFNCCDPVEPFVRS